MVLRKLSLLFFLLASNEVQSLSAQENEGFPLEIATNAYASRQDTVVSAITHTEDSSIPTWVLLTSGLGYVIGITGMGLAYRSYLKRKKAESKLQAGGTVKPVPKTEIKVETPEVSDSKDDTITEVVLCPTLSKDFSSWKAEEDATDHTPIVLIIANEAPLFDYISSVLDTSFQIRKTAWNENALEMIHEVQPQIILCEQGLLEKEDSGLLNKLKDAKVLHHTPVLSCGLNIRQSELENLFRKGIHSVWGLQGKRSDLVRAINYLIHKVSVRNNDAATGEVATKEEIWVQKAKDYVEQHLSKSDLSVEELSRAVGISRVHLYNKLMEQTGMSPLELIRNMRLEKALTLLEEELSIAEVAEQVGFSNPKKFTKNFKDKYGILPSIYQKEAKESPKTTDE